MLVGVLGGIITYPSIPNWYVTLQKPLFSPPNWIFGPVWTILYVLMGIAAAMIWGEEKREKQRIEALSVFAIQLGLNFLWSILFFGLRSPLTAFIEIIALWLFILITVKRFYLLNKNAGYLLFPYLLWVTFASILNFSIVLLN